MKRILSFLLGPVEVASAVAGCGALGVGVGPTAMAPAPRTGEGSPPDAEPPTDPGELRGRIAATRAMALARARCRAML